MASDAAPTDGPMTAEQYINRALDRHDHYDYPRAIRLLTTALHLDPDNADAYFHRGHAYRLDGNLTAANPDYTRALTLDPHFAAAYYHRAGLRKAQLDLEGAIADYTAYLRGCQGLCEEDRREVEQSIRDLRAELGRRASV